jgi:tetratricopeptide (TPR) repeat protein
MRELRFTQGASCVTIGLIVTAKQAHKIRPLLFPLSLVALAALGLLVYGKSLGNGFTNWDDTFFLEDPSIRGFNIQGIFTQTLLSNYYPLTLLSLAFDLKLGGGIPFTFHLTSFLLHLLNSLLVVIFTLRLFNQNRLLAFLTGAIFLIHPVQVEAISWVAARNYPLSTAFCLGSLIFYHRHLSAPGTRRSYWYAWGLFLLALLGKPQAVVLPALFLVMDAVFSGKIRVRDLLGKIPFILPAIPMAALTIQGYSAPGASSPEIFQLSFVERAFWAAKGVAFYLHQFVFPLQLSAYYDIQQVEISFCTCLPLLLTACLLVIYCKYRTLRSPGATFGLAFFAITLLPALKLIPFGEYSIFNDRYLYLPCLGLLFFYFGVFFNLAGKLREKTKPSTLTTRMVSVSLVALAIAPLTLLSQERAKSWADGETLWREILRSYPATAMAHNNLGRVFLERGDWAQAEGEFRQAIASRPGFDKPYYNLGLVADHFKQPDAAAEFYRKALTLNPVYAEAHNNLGNYHSKRSEHAQALAHYLKGIESGGNIKELYFNAAWSFHKLGNIPECHRYLGYLLKMDPEFTPALQLLKEVGP